MRSLIRSALLCFAALLILLSALFATLQTDFARNWLRQKVITIAKEKGLSLSIDSLEGALPLEFVGNNIELQISSSDRLQIEKLQGRIAFFPLLFGELSFSEILLSNASFTYANSASTGVLQNSLSFPWSFSVKLLEIDRLSLENRDKKESALFTVRAQGTLKRGMRYLFADVEASSPSLADNHILLKVLGVKPEQKISADLYLKTPSTELFHLFYALPFESKFSLHAHLEGSASQWRNLALQGYLRGDCDSFELSGAPLLNQRWRLDTSFFPIRENALEIQECRLESALFEMKAQGVLNSWNITEASSSFAFPDLSLLAPQMRGSLRGDLCYDGKETSIDFSTANFKVEEVPLHTLAGIITATRQEKTWQGSAKIVAKETDFPLVVSSEFVLSDLKTLNLEEISLTGPDTRLSGALLFDFQKRSLEGSLLAHILSINHLRAFFPSFTPHGSLGAELHFVAPETMRMEMAIKNLRWGGFSADDLILSADLREIWHGPQGEISLEGRQISLPKLSLSTLSCNSSLQKQSSPFSFHLKGIWKDHIEVKGSGSWAKQLLTLNSIEGLALRKTFSLRAPTSLSWAENTVHLADTLVRFGEGTLSASADFDRNRAEAKIEAQHFPLDFLSLSHPNLNLVGTTSLKGYLSASQENIEGRFSLYLEEADLLQAGTKEALKARGSIQAHLDQRRLQFEADLTATENQFFDWKGSVPIQYTLYPFSLSLNREEPLSSELTMEGKLEELFDFVDLGTHRCSGLLSCHLFLSKTLASPSLMGVATVQGGTYENYYTGTKLNAIEAVVKAENGKVILSKLDAKDDSEGSLTAQGELLLNPSQRFPYSISAELEKLTALQLDLVTAEFTGPLEVQGDTKAALAKGRLTVANADFEIPEALPLHVPSLSVSYINQPAHIQPSTLPPAKIFPLAIDLDLSAPDQIFVNGRGLRSEWKGDVHLTGSNSSIAANGSLSLIRGEFAFAGQRFSLTQGEITFVDKTTQNAYLSLQGTLTLADLTIIVLLNGPLSSPRITFQSMPYLPTSSLLSRVLFNKDISEISPFQAIQLAQMIVTLSGGSGIDVLETIRKSIGVDRLNIVSSGASDEISVQIGKYLVEGVMVTLSQGVDSSQILVEVELKHGFVLQAETQDDEEGKFSLKWNLNY